MSELVKNKNKKNTKLVKEKKIVKLNKKKIIIISILIIVILAGIGIGIFFAVRKGGDVLYPKSQHLNYSNVEDMRKHRKNMDGTNEYWGLYFGADECPFCRYAKYGKKDLNENDDNPDDFYELEGPFSQYLEELSEIPDSPVKMEWYGINNLSVEDAIEDIADFFVSEEMKDWEPGDGPYVPSVESTWFVGKATDDIELEKSEEDFGDYVTFTVLPPETPRDEGGKNKLVIEGISDEGEEEEGGEETGVGTPFWVWFKGSEMKFYSTGIWTGDEGEEGGEEGTDEDYPSAATTEFFEEAERILTDDDWSWNVPF